MKKDIEICPVEGIKSNKSFCDTRNLLDFKIPSYDQMISEMAQLIFKRIYIINIKVSSIKQIYVVSLYQLFYKYSIEIWLF